MSRYKMESKHRHEKTNRSQYIAQGRIRCSSGDYPITPIL